MRRFIEVDDIWTGGCRAAARFLKDQGAGHPPCPFTLDGLLAAEFDLEAGTAKIAAR